MAKLPDGRCRRGFVLIPPQELSLRRQKSFHDKGHHPHAEAAWGASRERLLPGTGKQLIEARNPDTATEELHHRVRCSPRQPGSVPGTVPWSRYRGYCNRLQKPGVDWF